MLSNVHLRLARAYLITVKLKLEPQAPKCDGVFMMDYCLWVLEFWRHEFEMISWGLIISFPFLWVLIWSHFFFFPVLCLKISFWCFETQPECPSKIINNFSMPFLKPLLLHLALGDNKDWHSSDVELRLVLCPTADGKTSGQKLWSHCSQCPGCICLYDTERILFRAVTAGFQKH